ncbi:DNA polymerase III tau subunit V interacting with alpha [compost metagenome]
MVLLRMLAFRPGDAEGAPRSPLKDLGISKATADSTHNPVAGAAVAAPVVAAAPRPAPVIPAPVPVVEPQPAAPIVEAVAVEPVAVDVPVEAAIGVAEPAVEAAAKIDLPWEAPQAAPPVVEAQPAEAALPPVAPVVVEASVEPAVVAVAEPAVAVAGDESDDDEPPPGDYDYYEADAESYDYDFSAAEKPAAEVEPLPAVQPATGLAAEWLELFPRLGISGLTGSIGANCTLVAVEGDTWRLHLDPAQGALFNATQQRRLNDALNQFHGRPLKLEIELRKPEQETPAQAAARKRAERQRSAEASIHNDPLVQQMIQQFAAVIRDGSIEPVDTPS